MAPVLRPRQQRPPSDHSYSCLPSMPVYGQAPIVVSGPGGIFVDRVMPAVKVRKENPPKKKKKRRYYGERKRRFKTKRVIVGKQNTASQGRRRSATLSRPPDGADQSCDNGENQSDAICDVIDKVKVESPLVRNDDAPHVWSVGESNISGKKSGCCCCGWKRLKLDRRHSARLVKKNYKLPFNSLPDVVKLHIFSCLTLKERAAATLVCSEWAQLMKSPRLWNDIDFTVFDPPIQKLKHSPQAKSFQFRWFTTCTEYNAYRLRLNEFLVFLKGLRPMVENLKFAFDIAHPKDEWLQVISTFLDNSQCRDLTSVNIDWMNTPVRPPCADVFCCLFNKGRVLFNHHIRRIRIFHKLLDQLTKVAPHLSNVTMPFDWSPRSVLLMSRLKEVRMLRLQKYILLRVPDQYLLDRLLQSLGQLYQLTLDVCMPTYRNMQLYSITHQHLHILDISQCQGFFLKSVQLPELRVLRVDHMPWQGPLVARETTTIPCLYGILRDGAPKLEMINKHRIQEYWVEFMYKELDTALAGLCPCKDHTLNWNI